MERMLLIGNPDNKRTNGIQQARMKLGLPPAAVLSYLDLLQGRMSLQSALEAAGWGADAAPVLRLDAPGEHFAVERELIALGAPDQPREKQDDRLLPLGYRSDPQPLSIRSALALKEQTGRIYHPSQWFRGYARLLARLESEASERWPGGGRWLNAPADIVNMFDKRQTHRVLSAAGVPVPRLLAPPEELTDYEILRERMLSSRLHRVFIKLAAGSGASGVIAYQLNPVTGAEIAVTTVGIESFIARPSIFYNTRKLRRYTDGTAIRPIVNWLLRHGAHVERWIAKAAYRDRTFDIRQLVVGGEACHRIARVSGTPITNLHLRSERMRLDDMMLPAAVQNAVSSCAEQALAAFPGSSVAGVDVLLDNGSGKPYVVDMNPFGDLLYNVDHQGLNTYEWEMKKLDLWIAALPVPGSPA